MSGKQEQKSAGKPVDDGDTVASLRQQIGTVNAENSKLRSELIDAHAASAGFKECAERRDEFLKRGLIDREAVTREEAEAEEFDPIEAALYAIDARNRELVSARRSLSAQKGATTKAKNEVVQLEEASRPRSLGAMVDKKPLAAAELLELVHIADDVELAFSNGRTELAGVPPVRLTGEPFTLRRGALRLNADSLKVTGPNTTKAPQVVSGFALLLDGEQVAWAPLSSPIALGAGQTYDLKDSVRF